MSWTGEIEPATIEQVRMGRDGKMHVITEDAGGIAKRLREIDSRLHLRYSEAGEYYVVYAKDPELPEGSGWTVGTFQELDGRIVKSIEETYWKNRQPGYSLGEETNALEDKRLAEADRVFHEQTQEMAERLAHAIRKDTHATNRAFIAKGLNANGD